jgi:hypothetical protein
MNVKSVRPKCYTLSLWEIFPTFPPSSPRLSVVGRYVLSKPRQELRPRESESSSRHHRWDPLVGRPRRDRLGRDTDQHCCLSAVQIASILADVGHWVFRLIPAPLWPSRPNGGFLHVEPPVKCDAMEEPPFFGEFPARDLAFDRPITGRREADPDHFGHFFEVKRVVCYVHFK